MASQVTAAEFCHERNRVSYNRRETWIRTLGRGILSYNGGFGTTCPIVAQWDVQQNVNVVMTLGRHREVSIESCTSPKKSAPSYLESSKDVAKRSVIAMCAAFFCCTLTVTRAQHGTLPTCTKKTIDCSVLVISHPRIRPTLVRCTC